MLKTMLSRSWRHALVLSSLLALTLPTLALPAPIQAATDWQNEVRISENDSAGNYEPAVAVDTNGCTHVAWHGGTTQDQWRVYYSNNRDYTRGGCGASFNSPQRISSDSGEHRSVDIAVSNDGHVHVVASRRFEGLAEINYMESNNYGQSWTNRIRNISNSDGSAFEPSVAVDSNNNVYFAWIDNGGTSTYVTKYTLRINGVYGDTDNVSTTFDKAPKLVVTGSDANQVVHFAYQGRSPRVDRDSAFEIYYSSGVVVLSDPTTGRYRLQLTKPVPLTNDNNAWAVNAAIASNGANELYIAYEWSVAGNHDIYLLRSINLGASWTAAGNITPRNQTIASFPSLAFGLSFNRPTLTIAWDEGTSSQTNVYAAEYYPDANAFDPAQPLLNKVTSDASRINVGANLQVNRVSSAFQARQGSTLLRVFAATRGSTLTAVPVINGGATRTNNPALSVTLTDVNGSPTQMRYAVDRNPSDSDAWLPFQPSFAITVPASSLCERSVNVQVRNAQGAASTVASDKIVVDTVVSASVSLSNPGIGDPAYTGVLSANVRVQPDQECSTLTVESPVGLTADGFGGFKGAITLADNGDRPRDVKIIVDDSAGNRRDYDQVITVDRGAPTLSGGKLLTTSGALSALQTDLLANDFSVTDTIFPAGYWGVQVANTLNFSATDSSLSWQTFQLRANDQGDLVVKGWSVASGLGQRPSADTPIEVRLRFIDGAGNPSSALTTTVTLAAGFSDIEVRAPLLLK